MCGLAVDAASMMSGGVQRAYERQSARELQINVGTSSACKSTWWLEMGVVADGAGIIWLPNSGRARTSLQSLPQNPGFGFLMSGIYSQKGLHPPHRCRDAGRAVGSCQVRRITFNQVVVTKRPIQVKKSGRTLSNQDFGRNSIDSKHVWLQ